MRDIMAWLKPENASIERLDLDREAFEPTHPAYYEAPAGKPLRLLLQARANLLAIWREKHFEPGIGEMKIFRRQVLVVNAPEAIKYVVATRHENFERKSPQMRRALEHLLGDGLFISDGDTWKQRRPLVADIVHKSRVPAFGGIMAGTTEELVERWNNLGDGASVNMLHEMAGLTAEIIARSVFGNDLGPDGANEVTEGFTDYQSLVDSVNFCYFVGMDEGMPLFRTPSMKRAIKRIHRIIDKVVEDHLAGDGGDKSSMLDLLIRRQKRNPELKLDVVALRNEAATIFMAGHETTAATLTWIWYLLSRAPWVEKAVHDEIARVCGDRVPGVADVPELEWCRAVVEEALRLYPPVPILARQAKDADRIGKHDVKAASLILIVPWLLHRTEELFPDAHSFKPERFMNGKRPTPYSYIPFAIGPRICPGLQFGLTEAILCLAVIAQKYRVRVQENHKVEAVFQLTLRPKGGMPVTLHRR
ncbi:cytochrome P450 [Rhizobium sp. 32-5/1]|uniref:cytochrome P450 n=1 Tax=Rhizobium sp. 32-5/1 TaxID=3019602 RepID=UPI00240E5A0F|nr:cytochrome P450 [Rhizobium sp. 32-5/1]WEZ83852.1 cytochrome P450 [Rhizobium sp. 32-5/1]